MIREIYLVIILAYTWYRSILLFISHFNKKLIYPAYNGKVSIIIPVYNEKKDILSGLIGSVVSATKNLNAEIIIGDDGSDTPVNELVKEIDYYLLDEVKIIRFPHRGKRETQKSCIEIATGDVIVTIDSDVLMERQAIYELVKPFKNPKIGAVTGNIKILNEEKNWLTKATATMYWNAFNVARHSLSGFGIVNVCSGALSAYRRTVINKILYDYTNQYFLGKKCTYGDDRALTNMVLQRGYGVVFSEDSICYTISPSNISGFVKQQHRWRQSMIRESFITFKFSFRRNKLLFVENLFLIMIPFFNVIIMSLLIITLWKYTFLIIPIIVGTLIVTIIHNLFLLIEHPTKLRYALIYTILTYVLLIWLWPIALFNLRKDKWGTR